jgi:hypothetical protein
MGGIFAAPGRISLLWVDNKAGPMAIRLSTEPVRSVPLYGGSSRRNARLINAPWDASTKPLLTVIWMECNE